MKVFNFDEIKTVHFIGIGGISMSALAEYCLLNGKTVSGSDGKYCAKIGQLRKLGAKISVGHKKTASLGKDLVVYSSAIKENLPELATAKNGGAKKVMKRGEFLGAVLSRFKTTVAVSGSHGKTTATAMIAHILEYAGFNPTAFIGGEDKTFSNFRSGGSEIAVAEACEYKKNFLYIKPKIAVILNVDNDHLDSYKTMKNVKAAFRVFAENSIAVINADDCDAMEAENRTAVTFGIKRSANYTARNIKKNGSGYSFTVYEAGRRRARIGLIVPGRYNVYNALAAFTVCSVLGADDKSIKTALEHFTCVLRRTEKIGTFLGADAFADYAHHPNEIKAELKAVSDKNTLVVFQPHTYSRTRILMKDFVCALKNCEKLIIFKTYPAREKFNADGDARKLYERIKKESKGKVFYAESEAEIITAANAVGKFTRTLFLGAGDIYKIAKKMANRKI